MAEMNRIALVTGANKGIGYEIARQLGGQGIAVLVGARDPAKGEAAVKQLQDNGVKAEAVTIDVTDDASVNQAAELISSRYERLDILVNNAGIMGSEPHKPSEMPAASYQQTYDTNLYGPIRVTNALLPLLSKAPAGRIVNVSSTLGSMARSTGMPAEQVMMVTPYNSSKSALNRIMLDYAAELADTPIKINNVCPGYVATDLNGRSGPRSPEEGARIAVTMATLPADGPSGTFQDENGIIPW